MRTLLAAIKSALQAAFAGVVRPSDIFITVDPQFVPPSLTFPAIAIKDGDLYPLYTEDGEEYGAVGKVEVTVYAQVLKPEAAIMGDEGVLALEKSVIATLAGNALGLDYWRVAPVYQKGSELFGNEQLMAQSKTVVFEYAR